AIHGASPRALAGASDAHHKRGEKGKPRMRGAFLVARMPQCSSGMISSATMLMILISGFTAGPAVSLYGSPTLSPVTAALCASEPLPPKLPSSMYFFSLSHAPPPFVIEI